MNEEPIAWLIRATWTGGPSTILAGAVFKSAKTANAAAKRMSNRFKQCTAVPVFEPTVQQLRGLE